MTLETLIDDLLSLYQGNPSINSTGYGETEAYSTSKTGVEYIRAYLHLEEATNINVKLTLTVTDDVLSDLSNRLQVQSNTLTVIKELTQIMIVYDYIHFDDDLTYEPTKLYQEDASEGWKVSFEIRLDEDIDVCNQPQPLTN